MILNAIALSEAPHRLLSRMQAMFAAIGLFFRALHHVRVVACGARGVVIR